MEGFSMSAPTEPRHAPTASANGDLVNRVQQLRLDNQVGAVRRSRGSWLPWILCAMLAVSWAAVGVKWLRTQPAPSGDEAARATGGAARSPDKPLAPGELLFQLKGNLIPSLQIAVSPVDVGGEVTEIHFKEGDVVKKDQILAVIRDTRYQNEFNSAEASYRAALQRLADLLPEAVRQEEKDEWQAQITEAEANRLQASQELTRVREQLAKGSGSPFDEEKAVANLKAYEARVEKLKKSLALLNLGARQEKVLAGRAEVAAAKARMDEADRLRNNCIIKAPIDGTILSKKADVGSLVSPASFNVSASLCEIADLKKLEVEVDVPELQIAKLIRLDPKDATRGMPWDCEVVPDAAREKKYRGFVDRIMPIADDGKNVIRIRVRVYLPEGEAPGALLRPKMGIVVTGFNRRFEPSPNDQKWGDEPASLK
jgi:multidrug efflux pump subunit AcrA (membrane-fusion protein)